MKSLLEILNKSIEFLQKKGIENPRRQAEEILSDAIGIKRLQLYVEFERPLTEPELEKCRERLVRRAQGEPSQYIHGSVEFFDCHLDVTRDVLIPRQETELLVDRMAKELAKENLAGKTLWDVCCGSGCIGIALKKRFSELNLICSDLSPAALTIAKQNAEKNAVEIKFLEGDLLEPFVSVKADFLVCNPPYISEGEYQTLSKEVKNFEPKKALVAGPTGLEFYMRLSRELKEKMQPGGKVWMEIGHQQGPSLIQLFSNYPAKQVQVEKDYSGHDRFFFLENE